MVKIVLPFVYRNMVRPHNRKATLAEFHIDHVEAEVAEIAVGEMTPVVSWGELGHRRDCMRWNGRLYLAARFDKGPTVLATTLPGEWLGHRHQISGLDRVYGVFGDRDRTGYRSADNGPADRRKPYWPNPVPLLPDGSVVESTLAADIALMRVFADSLLIVDGHVWRAVTEPVVSVEFFGGTQYVTSAHSGEFGFGTFAAAYPWSPEVSPLRFKTFGLGQASVVETFMKPLQYRWKFGQVVTTDPGGLAFDPAADLVKRAISHAVYGSRRRVGSFQTEQATRWADLRAASKRYSGEKVLPVDGRDLETLRAFAHDETEPYYRRTLAECLDEVDNPSVDAAEWLSRGRDIGRVR